VGAIIIEMLWPVVKVLLELLIIPRIDDARQADEENSYEPLSSKSE
jgi:hypothetical protein